MPIPAMTTRVGTLIAGCRDRIHAIESTHIGMPDLFSEHRILKDMELLQEGSAYKTPLQMGLLVALMIKRHPKLSQILYPH